MERIINYKYLIENLTNLDGHPIEKMDENTFRLNFLGEWHIVEKKGSEYKRKESCQDQKDGV